MKFNAIATVQRSCVVIGPKPSRFTFLSLLANENLLHVIVVVVVIIISRGNSVSIETRLRAG
jgi:hypothetical protein